VPRNRALGVARWGKVAPQIRSRGALHPLAITEWCEAAKDATTNAKTHEQISQLTKAGNRAGSCDTKVPHVGLCSANSMVHGELNREASQSYLRTTIVGAGAGAGIVACPQHCIQEFVSLKGWKEAV